MSKTKKVFLIIFIIIVAISAAFTYMYIEMKDNLDYLNEIQINDIDLNLVDDGIYIGEYEVFPVSVTLSVEVVNHEIVDIVIIEHDNGQGLPAEAIIDDVVLNQTLQVDSIAGATYSSRVVLLAIQDALLNSQD